MNENNWLWFALIAFLGFCFLSLLFMGMRGGRQRDAIEEKDRNSDE
jgi:hypothetical protein